MSKMNNEDLSTLRTFSVKQVAALLSVSTDYVLARIKDGSIRHIDLGSTRPKYRIRVVDYEAFVDSRMAEGA